MTVTVENTQVYVTPVEAMEKIVNDFFDFPTALDYEEILSRVAVAVTSEDASCVISTSPSLSQSSAASLLEY